MDSQGASESGWSVWIAKVRVRVGGVYGFKLGRWEWVGIAKLRR